MTHDALSNDAPSLFGFDIPAGDGLSKAHRVAEALKDMPSDQIAKIAVSVGAHFSDFDLEEAGQKALELSDRPISQITRREIAQCFGDDLMAEGDLIGTLTKVFPTRMIGTLFEPSSLADEIARHMLHFPGDWSVARLFDEIGAYSCSRKRFCELIEAAMHPLARRGAEQAALVEQINPHLRRDGYHLVASGEVSGYPLYQIEPITRGVKGTAKNLIFASKGHKPEIGFADAINNDIVILSNAESCLIYDRPLRTTGLLWTDLVDWWVKDIGSRATDPAKELGERLQLSLQSEPERTLFRLYFKAYRAKLSQALPALIPQVYLHYDPAVVSRLTHRDGLVRQRMDFLLLLPNAQRIVLEVDGAQHYSIDGRASPSTYGRMAKADRELRLLGYEVYRFGASELLGDGAIKVVTEFFDGLWKVHHPS